MVVVEFTYEEMKRLVDLPRDRMIASLSEMGAPSEYEPETGKIMAELTPNRPDWYSMEGLARALKTYYSKKSPSYKTVKSDYVVKVDPSVAAIRPYTVCAVVKGLCFDDQRIRDMVLLQEKLHATLGRKVKKFGMGIYPLRGIEFPVSYTTRTPGEIHYRPLGHEKDMTAEQILKEHKKGQEYGYLLQGRGRYPVFTDAKGNMMALIPVVNSAETGKVDEQTKEIFIEVTGNDINACKAALNILVCTFSDMGGEIHEVRMEYSKEKFISPDLKPRKMKIDMTRVNGVLGTGFKQKDVEAYLKKMGYGYGRGYAVIPPYRADILDQVDIIEDIAIAHGYNNFKPTTADFFTPGNVVRKYDLADSTMRGMGFLEVKTFILTSKENLAMLDQECAAEITNPNNVEYTVVRPSLLVSMLEVFAVNKMKGLPQKFYEIGEVQTDSTVKKLVFGIMDKKVDFSEMRGCLQTLAQEHGLAFDLEKKPMAAFDPVLSCAIVSKNREIGVLGKICRDVLLKLGIDYEVYVCEMEL